MANHNWFLVKVILWLLLCYDNLCVEAQSQNAIGAHRIYQKTSFSCAGRGSGYYADVETGCQVYHMCDGLGRQFSYSCPNTTLFQQRMLICDHWYMVNCSKAESDYTANLLIGQRDKPFVTNEESNLRTPRPDLLDRPYAPDYSGESFRNQYAKTLSPLVNQIYDKDEQKNREKNTQQFSADQPANVGQQRWKIPPPSRIILPPAYEPQIDQEELNAKPSNTAAKVAYSPTVRLATASPTTSTTTRRPATTTYRPQQFSKNPFLNNVAALHNRQQDDHLHFEHDDLGTSHSTRYNTSADFNSAEDRNQKNKDQKSTGVQKKVVSQTVSGTAKPTTFSAQSTTSSSSNSSVKVPSKIYEPPFVYPIYNLEEGTTTTSTTTARPSVKLSTASPFVTRQTVTTPSTTTKAPTRPTTAAGQPFSRGSTTYASSTANTFIKNLNRYDANKLTKEIRTAAPAQGFKPPTPKPPVKQYNSATQNTVDLPAKNLLPPLTDFVQHDVATTQGPPIYYEWKVPSNGLEPPKLEPPIGVDGREYPDTVIDYNAISANSALSPVVNSFGIDQTAQKKKDSLPTSRSIKDTAQPNGVERTNSNNNKQQKAAASTKSSTTTQLPSSKGAVSGLGDILQIRKDLSVPEYAFPLESNTRTGYLSSDVYNSFQLKIPERRSDDLAEQHIHWYGENPKCPQCHPSYVIPGTCEPCLRR